MKKILLTIVLWIGIGAALCPAAAREGEYRTAVKTLMDKSGSLSAADTMMDQMIPALSKMAPQEIPASFWTGFRQKWEAKSREKLVDIYTPIYRKYFTLSEIREMIAFYETPVGQKLATSLPAITQEGFAAGQQLGKEIAAEMIRELQQL